jgi:hypothetical protein
MTIYLYVKTHLKTGLKYLGKTKQDPYKYRGSGIRWLNHIKKHGYDVWTNVIFQSECDKELSDMGVHFSLLWNIVESDDWANLKPETGDGGFVGDGPWNKNKILGPQDRELVKRRTAASGKARRGKSFSEDHRKALSDSHKGNSPWNKGKKGKQIAWNKGIPNQYAAGTKFYNNGEIQGMYKPGLQPKDWVLGKLGIPWNKGKKSK